MPKRDAFKREHELITFFVPDSVFADLSHFPACLSSQDSGKWRNAGWQRVTADPSWILEGKGTVQSVFATAVMLSSDLERPCISNTCSACSASLERICSWPSLSAHIVSAFTTHRLDFQSVWN